jgi:hypothetical protein
MAKIGHDLLLDPDGSTSMVSWRSIENFQILASRISWAYHEELIQWLPLGDRVWSNIHNRVLGFGDAQRGFEAVNRFSEVWLTFKWV